MVYCCCENEESIDIIRHNFICGTLRFVFISFNGSRKSILNKYKYFCQFHGKRPDEPDVNTFKLTPTPTWHAFPLFWANEVSKYADILRENGGNIYRFCMLGYPEFHFSILTPSFRNDTSFIDREVIYNICKFPRSQCGVMRWK